MNYQGVLRNAADAPLSGPYDMEFRFYSANLGGDEIIVDTHAGTTVSNGLFSVELGGGVVADGTGPGTYTSLEDVFRDYAGVWLEVRVGVETLAPRTKVQSVAYALNSANLDGRPPSMFLDDSPTDQSKVGHLTVGSALTPRPIAITGLGTTAGGFFFDLDSGGQAHVGYGADGIQALGTAGGYGIRAYGQVAAGYFKDLSILGNATEVSLGTGGNAINAQGDVVGGQFSDANESGYALAAFGHTGIEGWGNFTGGHFLDPDSGGEAYVGYGTDGIHAFGDESGGYGIRAYGYGAGGYFADSDSPGTEARIASSAVGVWAQGLNTGGSFREGPDTPPTSQAFVASFGWGIDARGIGGGGEFTDTTHSGHAYVAIGDTGIVADGTSEGGYFADSNGSGEARLGFGDYGISASGRYPAGAGGHFEDSLYTGRADLAVGDSGIVAKGTFEGGEFDDSDSSGFARVAYGDSGIVAIGNTIGGEFSDSNSSGYARAAYGDHGIEAFGSTAGGYFDDWDSQGFAYIADQDRGIWARGTPLAATFSHPNGVTHWVDVGTTMFKIGGTGAVAFVQNHPQDPDRVIVYAAPEGDEVATYTRGTARLVNGKARIPLGETFAWVTNPDVGLTAQVTPRDRAVPLAVTSLSTSEIVVSGPEGAPADVTFDYMVFGLRIGFEELGIVQKKKREALLPADEDVQATFAGDPGLRGFNALERFQGMGRALGKPEKADLSRSRALKDAIDAHRDEIIAKADAAAAVERAAMRPERRASAEEPGGQPARPAVPRAPAPTGDLARDLAARAAAIAPLPPDDRHEKGPYAFMEVVAEVEPGDLLVIDPSDPGTLARCTTPGDPNVIGVAADASTFVNGRAVAPVAAYGIVTLKVDATERPIRPGDLLVGSSIAGHATRAVEPPAGTVIAKALEPLEAGTGLIRVLVMPR